LAHSHKKKSLEVVHPWTPEMVKANVENVSVCMTIKYGGPKAERLVSVETSLAEKVVSHKHDLERASRVSN
jgi:copper(I)-binding protein